MLPQLFPIVNYLYLSIFKLNINYFQAFEMKTYKSDQQEKF